MENIKVTESVRMTLRYAMLDEQDLRESLKQGISEEVPGDDGSLRCTCFLAVRRQLDPETAELRRLEVSYRRSDEGIEVFDLEGLELPPGVETTISSESG
jgi:hypothetical protein